MTVLPGATESPAKVPPPPRRDSNMDSSVVLPADLPWPVSSVTRGFRTVLYRARKATL